MDRGELPITHSFGDTVIPERWEVYIHGDYPSGVGVVTLAAVPYFCVKGKNATTERWYKVARGRFMEVPKPVSEDSKYPQLRPTAQATPELAPPDSPRTHSIPGQEASARPTGLA